VIVNFLQKDGREVFGIFENIQRYFEGVYTSGEADKEQEYVDI